MARKQPVVGRARGNIMPIKWMGVDFEIPLERKYRGKTCREYSFSPTKSTAKMRAEDLRKKGDLAHVKKFTESAKGYPRYKKTIYVVYRCRRRR